MNYDVTEAPIDIIETPLSPPPTDSGGGGYDDTAIKASIAKIEALLASDDINLDELQELVNAIKANKDVLDNDVLGKITTLETTMTTISGDAVTIKNDIAIIKTALADVQVDLVQIKTDIATNATAIATIKTEQVAQDTALATNTTDIATNKADIVTNTTGIATNKADIATNATAIEANITKIDNNAIAIATNKADIATNKADIATNTTNIGINTTAIATNTTAIATNTTDIATNKADIAANTALINALGADEHIVSANFDDTTNTLTLTAKDGTTSNVVIPDDKVLLTDNLTSTSITTAPTSNQLKIVNDKVEVNISDIEDLDIHIARQRMIDSLKSTGDIIYDGGSKLLTTTADMTLDVSIGTLSGVVTISPLASLSVPLGSAIYIPYTRADILGAVTKTISQSELIVRDSTYTPTEFEIAIGFASKTGVLNLSDGSNASSASSILVPVLRNRVSIGFLTPLDAVTTIISEADFEAVRIGKFLEFQFRDINPNRHALIKFDLDTTGVVGSRTGTHTFYYWNYNDAYAAIAVDYNAGIVTIKPVSRDLKITTISIYGEDTYATISKHKELSNADIADATSTTYGVVNPKQLHDTFGATDIFSTVGFTATPTTVITPNVENTIPFGDVKTADASLPFANGEFTITKAGIYIINAGVGIYGTQYINNYLGIRAIVNGAYRQSIASTTIDNNKTGHDFIDGSVVIKLNAGDKVSVSLMHRSNPNVIYSSTYNTMAHFTIAKI